MTQVSGNPIASTAGGVSNDASRTLSHDNLQKAGQRFEAIFTGMMLKSMRATHLAEGLFDNKAGDQFRDMQDAKRAESMAAHAPIGIGKAMTEFLKKSAAAPASLSAPAETPASATNEGAAS